MIRIPDDSLTTSAVTRPMMTFPWLSWILLLGIILAWPGMGWCEWQTFNTDRSGLAGNYVSSMLEDRWGNLWFGTYD